MAAVLPALGEFASAEYSSLSRKERAAVNRSTARAFASATRSAARGARKTTRLIRRGTTSARAIRRARAAGIAREDRDLPVFSESDIPVKWARKSATGMPSIQRGPTISAPIAVSTVMHQSYAKLLQHYKLSHREYIGNLHGSVDFAVTPYTINVGRQQVFPWLSRIALNFEMYTFKTLKFALKTQSSSLATGKMVLAIDYDPTDPPPTTMADLMQYQGLARGPPWTDVSLNASKEDINRLAKYFIAAAPAQETADIRLQDIGTLMVATEGQSSDAIVAELWCEYTVELIKPQASNRCLYQFLVIGNSPTESPFGSVTVNESSMGQVLSIWETNTLAFTCNVAGYYYIYEQWTIPATDPAAATYTSNFIINGAGVADAGPFFLSGVAGSTVMRHWGRYRLNYGDTLASAGDLAADATSYSIVIEQYEPTPSTGPMN